jgi:hypothetical protein
VEHLIAYNRSLDKKHLLTDEMKRAGVLPSSQAIFTWGVKKMGGVENRLLPEADLYTAFLEHKENVEVTVDGISMFGARYQSARLNAMRLRTGSNVSITVLYHPLRMWEAYWVTPDGALDELERDSQGTRNNGAASAYDIEAWALHLAALSIIEADKKPKRPGRLSRRQWDHMREMAGAVPKQQRKKATKDESLARRLEAAVEAGQRNYDRAEVHAPQKFGPSDPKTPSPSMRSGQESAPIPADYSPPAVPPPPRPQPSPQSAAAPPAPAGACGVGPSKGRMNTVELFARRRQAASDKAKGEDTK